MQRRVLVYLPPSRGDWVFRSSWVFRDAPKGLLGLVWVSETYQRMRSQPIVDYMFIDCKTGEIRQRDSYHWQGIEVEHIQLWTGDSEEQWILTWRGFPTEQASWSVLLSPVQWGLPRSAVSPVIVDEAFDMMTRMSSALFATMTAHDISVAFIKPDIDDAGESSVYANQLVPGMEREPEHIGTALRAKIFVQENNWYLLIFNAAWSDNEENIIEIPRLNFRKVVKSKPYWQFWIAGAEFPISEPFWKHELYVNIPATAYPYAEFWDDVVNGAAIISGPHWKSAQQNEQQTIIVAVGLIKKEAIGLPEEQAHHLRGGELLCLGQNGQVVQECKEEIVEQVSLCLVGDAIIGVDRIQRRWRLWCWEPLAGKEQFSTIQWLVEEVVHAHVVTNHENSDPQGTHFWLVEERPKGLGVSRRDGQTLEEVEEPITLTGWSLPYALERSVGEWDWPVKKGLIGHNDALLLIAADEQNQMVLYRVEAGNGTKNV